MGLNFICSPTSYALNSKSLSKEDESSVSSVRLISMPRLKSLWMTAWPMSKMSTLWLAKTSVICDVCPGLSGPCRLMSISSLCPSAISVFCVGGAASCFLCRSHHSYCEVRGLFASAFCEFNLNYLARVPECHCHNPVRSVTQCHAAVSLKWRGCSLAAVY